MCRYKPRLISCSHAEQGIATLNNATRTDLFLASGSTVKPRKVFYGVRMTVDEYGSGERRCGQRSWIAQMSHLAPPE